MRVRETERGRNREREREKEVISDKRSCKQQIGERCWTIHDGRSAQTDYKKIFG